MPSSGSAVAELYNVASRCRRFIHTRGCLLCLAGVVACLLLPPPIPVAAKAVQPLESIAEEIYILSAAASWPPNCRTQAIACAKQCTRRFKTNKLQIVCFKANRCVPKLPQDISKPAKIQ